MGRLADELALLREVGVFVHLIGRLGAAANGQTAERFQRGGKGVAKVWVGNFHSDTGAGEGVLQKARLVGLAMLDK